jgi:hypothetical protein
MDRIEPLAMRAAPLVQGFPELLQQRKAVGDLRGCRSPGPSARSRGGRAIARDALAPWRLPEPQSEGIGRALREERDRVAALQSDQHGAIRLACAQGARSHAEAGGRGERRGELPAQQAAQGVAASPQSPRIAAAHTGRTTPRHPKGHKALGQPQRAPGPGGGDRGQPVREEATSAVAMAAKPRAHPSLEAHTIRRPGEGGEGAFGVAVHAPGREGTERPGRGELRRAHTQGELRRGGIERTRREAPRGRLGQQTGQDGRGWCREESGLLLPSLMSLGPRRVCVPTASG